MRVKNRKSAQAALIEPRGDTEKRTPNLHFEHEAIRQNIERQLRETGKVDISEPMLMELLARTSEAFTVANENDEFVTIPRARYEALAEAAEEAADREAIRRYEAGEMEFLPAESVRARIEGKSALRPIRNYRGLTLDGLAEAMAERGQKVTKGFLSQIENNKKQPSLEMLRSLAGVLDVSIDDL